MTILIHRHKDIDESYYWINGIVIYLLYIVTDETNQEVCCVFLEKETLSLLKDLINLEYTGII